MALIGLMLAAFLLLGLRRRTNRSKTAVFAVSALAVAAVYVTLGSG